MECRSSFSQRLGVLLIFVLWGALLVWSLGVISGWPTPPLPVRAAGWAGVILVVFVFPTLRPLFSSRAVVILNDAGIDDARIGLGLIPWSDIASVSRYEIRGRPYIQFWLQDERAYLERWATWRRMVARVVSSLGYSPLSMNFAGISPGFEPVYAYIKRFVAERPNT
jgi:hypothetical protein